MNPTFDDNVQYPDMGNTLTNVVAYPVIFDEDRQQWFCDLAINSPEMYYPFIKLALARYQPHSVRKQETDVRVQASQRLQPLGFKPIADGQHRQASQSSTESAVV